VGSAASHAPRNFVGVHDPAPMPQRMLEFDEGMRTCDRAYRCNVYYTSNDRCDHGLQEHGWHLRSGLWNGLYTLHR
jgi:hypothetical protein